MWARAESAQKAADWTHAAQLGAAVGLAWGASALLHLPEGFWAVMSALIVLRPTAGATLGAGWDRIRGTLAGTLLGLAGVALRHLHGFDVTATTLVLVGLLAAASALLPWLRSAPITALIVLGSGGLAQHSTLQVAALRAVEIGIGVGVGLLLSFASLWQATAQRFDSACARALRRIADQVRRDFAAPPLDAKERERGMETLRTELRALAVLAIGVQREARIAAWLRRHPMQGDPVRMARIAARTLHDASAFARNAALRRPDEPHEDSAAMAAAVAAALEAAAAQLEGGPTFDETARRAHGRAIASSAQGAAWVQPSMRLLMQDLAALTKPPDAASGDRTSGACGCETAR
ncbi:Fusaric acid resistance protein family protein [Xylophilus ampelinus]|nr:FUSC family protein [Variovorax sp.]VTY39894.1 Fusaric acid resistance protein family protein [Xylophilus ampelinus]